MEDAHPVSVETTTNEQNARARLISGDLLTLTLLGSHVDMHVPLTQNVTVYLACPKMLVTEVFWTRTFCSLPARAPG